MELKHIISRGYTRKVNLGNYESADFFSNHSQELVDPTPDEILVTSIELSQQAREDVKQSIERFFEDRQTDKQKKEKAEALLPVIIENASKGKASNMEDYELVMEMLPESLKEINDAKKAWNRSQYKSKKKV